MIDGTTGLSAKAKAVIVNRTLFGPFIDLRRPSSLEGGFRLSIPTSHPPDLVPRSTVVPRLAVLGNGTKAEVREVAARLTEAIKRQPGVVFGLVDLSPDTDLTTLEADVALVLGGDGTVLHTVRRMKDNPTPVIGINVGRLGFLADLTPSQFIERLPDLATHRYTIENLMTLSCSILSKSGEVRKFRGLNEVVLRAAPTFHILEIDLSIDGESVISYRGDGLILATPVGSTAHSLSCGGPILPPNAQMFVVTPMGAHTLTQRPLVDSAYKVYDLKNNGEGSAVLVIDGQVQIPIEVDDRISVRRCNTPFPMVRLPKYSFYRTLRDKLGWGTAPPGDRIAR